MTSIWVLIRKRRKFYKQIISVYSPILKGDVYFTSDGFHHLIYESNRKPRNVNEQFLKLMCLEKAPDVIKNSTLISETRQIKRKVKGKLKVVTQYGLVYEVTPKKFLRVVIERVGTGKYRFRSVMPHNNASKIKKRLRKGAH